MSELLYRDLVAERGVLVLGGQVEELFRLHSTMQGADAPLPLSLSLSLSLSLTHTHTHTHTLALPLSVFLSLSD